MAAKSIKYKEYAYLMNRIAYWLINNKKSFKTRTEYNYLGKKKKYDDIISAIKKNGTKYQSDSLIAEFVECAIYDNKDTSYLPSYVSGSNGVKYEKKTFIDMANRVSKYEGNNGKSPAIVYLQNQSTTTSSSSKESISYDKYAYLMNRIAYWLVKNNKSFKKRDLYGYFSRTAKQADLINTIKKNGANYKSDSLIAEFAECAIFDNSKDTTFLPAYVSDENGKKYYKDCYIDMANRVSAYEVLNGKSPAVVYVQNPNTNSTTATTTTVNSTYETFVKYFGSVTDIDSCLAKVQGRGYSGYYNSKYDNITSIKRMYNKQGINCTDSAQVFYKLALALGYDVQFVHVRCSSGTGHVRLRLKHPVNTEGSYILRDSASVLSGNGIRSNWCTSNYTLLAYDPAWIFTDLG